MNCPLVCWKLHTLFNSDLVVYIHPVTAKKKKQWKGEQPGPHRKIQLCGMESPPTDIHQTNTEGVFDLMIGHCWDTFHCAQQGKSISPSCIWRGFHLFWSSLHQAGVKIGVFFSTGLLKVHLITQSRGEMVQRKAIQHPVWANIESSAPKVELKRKEKILR